MPSGVSRLDVRATIKRTMVRCSTWRIAESSRTRKKGEARANKGEVLTFNDHYFMIAPTLETSAKKYDELNGIQCIGKIVEDKNEAYVK
jgi:hypothetical protein